MPFLFSGPDVAIRDRSLDVVAVRDRPMERTSREEVARATLEHLDALHNLARYLTRRDREAEDLVQEAVARALSASSSFERGSNARAWLFRILRNVFIDQKRRERRSPFQGELEGDEAEPEASEPVRGDLDLDRMRGLVASDIVAAVLSLSADARTVILLDLEGFSEKELAEVLDCAVGTVKSRLSRARIALRERLKDYSR